VVQALKVSALPPILQPVEPWALQGVELVRRQAPARALPMTNMEAVKSAQRQEELEMLHRASPAEESTRALYDLRMLINAVMRRRRRQTVDGMLSRGVLIL